jgi:hypothetical protein
MIMTDIEHDKLLDLWETFVETPPQTVAQFNLHRDLEIALGLVRGATQGDLRRQAINRCMLAWSRVHEPEPARRTIDHVSLGQAMYENAIAHLDEPDGVPSRSFTWDKLPSDARMRWEEIAAKHEASKSQR